MKSQEEICAKQKESEEEKGLILTKSTAISRGSKEVWDKLERGGAEYLDSELHHMAGEPGALKELAGRRLEEQP